MDLVMSESAHVTIVPIDDPKPRTWYYGVRCACMRLVAVCEDLFSGKGDEDFLQLPAELAVQCDCGAVSHVSHFERFRTA
jgi:hypothetical protein